MCLYFKFELVWAKVIGTEAAHKMMIKRTKDGEKQADLFHFSFCCISHRLIVFCGKVFFSGRSTSNLIIRQRKVSKLRDKRKLNPEKRILRQN